MKKLYLIIIFFGVLCLCFPLNIFAKDYYIDQEKGDNENDGKFEVPWKTLEKANNILNAGDTVYLRAGKYSFQSINPKNSGKINSYITYSNYKDEKVILFGGRAPLNIIEKNYIKIKGIKFYQPDDRWGVIKYSNHVIIEDCLFDKYVGGKYYSAYRIVSSEYINHIRCSWTQKDQTADEEHEMISWNKMRHSFFYNCYFGDATHASIGVIKGQDGEAANPDGDYNAWINCFFNNRWHSAHGTGEAFSGNKRIIVQGCFFYDVGSLNHNEPLLRSRGKGIHPALYIKTLESIYRENIFYRNDISIVIRPVLGSDKGLFNWIYNNTVYGSDANDSNREIGTSDSSNASGVHVYSESGSNNDPDDFLLNKIRLINNIFYKAEGDSKGRHFRVYNMFGGKHGYGNIIEKNLFGDPVNKNVGGQWWKGQFETISYLDRYNSDEWNENAFLANKDPKIYDPDNKNISIKKRFSLSGDSPAIDVGRYITKTDGRGENSNKMKCDEVTWAFSGAHNPWKIDYPGISSDFIYFQKSDGDWIEREIIGIDYVNNIIVLSLPASWKNDTLIFYKKFSGSGPDLGAIEFNTLSSPTNLKLLNPAELN